MFRAGRNVHVAALAVVAIAVLTNDASAATKDFSATIAPTGVPAGRVVAVNATLANLTQRQQLGSANIAPPARYALVGITSLSLPAPASATLAGGVVELRDLSLRPRASATVTLTVQVPCAAGATARWNVVAKQANNFSGPPGNDLRLDRAASQLDTTTVGACTPCPEDEVCSATLGGPAGSRSTVVSDPNATSPDAGLLTMSIAAALDCAGYDERSPDTFNMDAPPNRPKHAVLTYADGTRPVTAKDPLEVCYAAPVQFEPKPKTALTTAVIDGVLNYVGRLPNCLGWSLPPCVTGRDDATRSIEFVMPTGDPRYM